MILWKQAASAPCVVASYVVNSGIGRIVGAQCKQL